MRPGDEVWMFNGGKVLYVIRPLFEMTDDLRVSLDLSGGLIQETIYQHGEISYKSVGECFILGLMDGEVLDFMGKNPKRHRPPPLESMDKELRSVHLV